MPEYMKVWGTSDRITVHLAVHYVLCNHVDKVLPLEVAMRLAESAVSWELGGHLEDAEFEIEGCEHSTMQFTELVTRVRAVLEGDDLPLVQVRLVSQSPV